MINIALIKDRNIKGYCKYISDHKTNSKERKENLKKFREFIHKKIKDDQPSELTSLCKETKDAWLSLGCAGYERKPAEEANIKFRRSVYFVKDISAGDVITKEHVRRIRPGYGLTPKLEKELIGRKVNKDIVVGTATSWELIDG